MFISNTPQQFWDRVAVGAPDECWKWLRSCTADGYGQLNWMGKFIYAHRLAMSLTDGDWDSRLHVLHRCDNPGCCNPAHLWRGTHTQNVRDMMAKGRGRKALGEANGMTSITAEQVKLVRKTKGTPIQISRQLGIGHSAVKNILSNRTWKHIP